MAVQELAAATAEFKAPHGSSSISILDAAPSSLHLVPAYLSTLTPLQRQRAWVPIVINAVVETAAIEIGSEILRDLAACLCFMRDKSGSEAVEITNCREPKAGTRAARLLEIADSHPDDTFSLLDISDNPSERQAVRVAMEATGRYSINRRKGPQGTIVTRKARFITVSRSPCL